MSSGRPGASPPVSLAGYAQDVAGQKVSKPSMSGLREKTCFAHFCNVCSQFIPATLRADGTVRKARIHSYDILSSELLFVFFCAFLLRLLFLASPADAF